LQTYSPLAQHSRRLLLTLFGGISGWTLFSVCCFLLLSGVLVNVATDAVKPVFEKLKPELLNCISNEVFATVLLLIALVLLLMILKWQAHKALTKDRLAVLKSETPAVDVLVQFLSALNPETQKTMADWLAIQAQGVSSTLPLADLEKCPWRMNLTAIEHQIKLLPDGRSIDLVVIPSQQSAPQWDLFAQVILQCFGSRVKLLRCNDFLQEPTTADNANYEDLQTVFLLLQKIQQRCAENPRRIVCFDATSGTKICSVAAAMVSLSQPQGVQYVSNDYKVQSYQLQYSKAEQ
jgi:hypothetical protein